jgi:hypothetical protein
MAKKEGLYLSPLSGAPPPLVLQSAVFRASTDAALQGNKDVETHMYATNLSPGEQAARHLHYSSLISFVE